MKRSENQRALGLCYYSTEISGLGGKIRQRLSDFFVEEISLDKKISYCLKDNKNISMNKPSKFIRLSFEKHGMDTLKAIHRLAEALNIPPESIGFAGMKDKNAITSQFISLKKIEINKIKELELKKIYLRNVHNSNSRLRIGDLFGNRFVITIRDIELNEHEIEKRVNSIMTKVNENNGLLNYYGIQRFGEIRPISHLVGKAILEKDYEKALRIYLTEIHPEEPIETRTARMELSKSWDFEIASEIFPKHLFYENLMINFLKKQPEKYMDALKALPKSLQSMLVYAYQSYIFNRILSRRKEQIPNFNELQINDYVLILDDQGLPTNAGFFVNEKNFTHIKNLIKKKRAVISAPLIGFDTQVKDDITKQVIEGEKIKIEDFKSNDLYFNPRGGFRPILFTPIGFTIKKITPDELNSSRNKVVLDFSLKRGTYASELIEEINKKLEK